MPIDSWHPCTESSNEPAQATTHWPTGCPNRPRMKDPSLHEPSKKVLQIQTCACLFRWKQAYMLIKAYQKCNHFKGLGCILRETESISHILKILIQPSSLTLNLASHPYLRLSSFERTILILIGKIAFHRKHKGMWLSFHGHFLTLEIMWFKELTVTKVPTLPNEPAY